MADGEEKKDALVPTTREVISMIEYDNYNDPNDIDIGRMPEGDLDPSEFDALPRRIIEIDPDDDGLVDNPFTGEEDSILGDDDEPPEPFSPPGGDRFPVFRSALRRFQSAEAKPRVVRIDTEATYGDFVCESAVKELDRRVRELRAVIEQHLSDHHGPPAAVLRSWDVIAGAHAVQAIRGVKSADEALDALPAVPLDLPEFARGKVQCWRDGASVVCSIHFATADGSHRIATMAARPNIDAREIAGCAARAGIDPVTILGVLDDVAETKCGERLVRDAAGAALQVHDREDVCGMSEPLLLTSRGGAGSAPLKALVYLQEQCDAGDPQARREMTVIKQVAETPEGQRVAGPLLTEVGRRVSAGRTQRALPAPKRGLLQRYAQYAGWAL